MTPTGLNAMVLGLPRLPLIRRAGADRVTGRPRADLPMKTVLLVGIFTVAYILNATELIQRVQAATGGVAASDSDAAAQLLWAFAPDVAFGGNTTTAAGANVVVAAVAAPAAVEAESSPAATHGSRTLRGG